MLKRQRLSWNSASVSLPISRDMASPLSQPAHDRVCLIIEAGGKKGAGSRHFITVIAQVN